MRDLGQLLSGRDPVIRRTGTGPVLPAWTPSSPNNPNSDPRPVRKGFGNEDSPARSH